MLKRTVFSPGRNKIARKKFPDCLKQNDFLVFIGQNCTGWEVAILHVLCVATLVCWRMSCMLKCQTFIERQELRSNSVLSSTQKSNFHLIFSGRLRQKTPEVKTLPPFSEPRSMTGSYFLSRRDVWKLNLSVIRSLFNSSVRLSMWCTDFMCGWPHQSSLFCGPSQSECLGKALARSVHRPQSWPALGWQTAPAGWECT